MFNLFIALFGGLYYAGKYAEEKSKIKATASRNQIFETINNTVNNYNVIQENKPRDMKKALSMVEEIGEDLEFVFGKDWLDIYQKRRIFNDFDSYKLLCSNYHPCDNATVDHRWTLWAIAYNIWLSKRGYITDTEYFPQTHIDGINYMKDDYPFLVDNAKEIILKMFRVVEKNIQKKHPDLNLSLWMGTVDRNRHLITWNYRIEHYGGVPQIKPW